MQYNALAAAVQVGCDPSLSSIPVLAQRSFADALAELAAWLAQPQNQDEFLLVFLDDQPDIKSWVSHCLCNFAVSAPLVWVGHRRLCLIAATC